jgi:hypothetical protein
MIRLTHAGFVWGILLMTLGHAQAQERSKAPRWLGEYDAQALAGAPVTQPAVIRNFGPVDLGGGGTRMGNGDQPAIDTTLYQNYYNPSFIGYHSYGAGNFYGSDNYASYGGMGYGGHPLGWTNYPPYAYRSRYLYPYRYYPLRTGFSVYNPYFYYNNTYYGGYASPFWTGYGGFGFPYHFGGYGAGGAGYTFGGFGYPYRYGVFGYPYPGLFSLTYSYMPSAAYFMYPGLGGLYVPPGFVTFPGYRGYGAYGVPLAPPNYAGALYW